MFHKEGHKIILITLLIVVGGFIITDNFITIFWLRTLIYILLFAVLILILQFFRNPKRYTNVNDNYALSPVDGKIVVIEEVFENERTTVVVENKVFGNVLFRQIAGALAKRIVNYAKAGNIAKQGEDSGFIKFGSRVDVFLPLNANVKVELNQKVKGGETILAETTNV